MWPGDFTEGNLILEQYYRFVKTRPSPEFWLLPEIAKDPYFQTFEWIRDLRTIGDNRSRRFIRHMILSWIQFQKKYDKSAFQPHIAALRLSNALAMHEFYAQSAEDRFLNTLNRYLYREYMKTKFLASQLHASFESVCILKGAIIGSLAYNEDSKAAAPFISRLTKILSQILFSDGFTQTGRVDVQFNLSKHLIDIRNFLRLCQDGGAAEKIQNFIERTTPPIRLLRHGDGKLSLLSGTDTATPQMVDVALSLSEIRSRHLTKSEHGGFEKLTLQNHTILIKTKPCEFLSQSTGNLHFEWSTGKDRLIKSCDLIVENEKGKALVSRTPARAQKYTEKDHVYLECELKDFDFQHTRQLYLTSEMDLRGQERITAITQGFGALRFILSPEFQVLSQPSKGSIILQSKKGERFNLSLSGADGLTIDQTKVFKESHPVVFALFQLLPHKEVELKWNFRGV